MRSSAIGFAVTNRAGLFISVNEAFCRLTGYSAEELRALNSLKIVHPEDVELCRDIFQQTNTRNLTDFSLEKRYLTKCGRTIWVQTLAHIVRDSHQRPRRVLHLVEDITEWKGVEEAARRRIAIQLHDTTCQNLSALVMVLGSLGKTARLDSSSQDNITESLTLAKEAANELRTLSFVLYPPAIDQLGFSDALRQFVRGFSRRTGIAVELQLPEDMPALPLGTASALFHVVQESLHNIWRHSGSSMATIGVQVQINRILLGVRDFGVGKSRVPGKGSDAAIIPGLGIAGMRNRIRELGGDLQVQFGASGTVVRAWIRRP
jgi:PAS domain S-box-containing protein